MIRRISNYIPELLTSGSKPFGAFLAVMACCGLVYCGFAFSMSSGGFVTQAYAQDAGKSDKAKAGAKGKSSELNEALRRIDRLEAQISEMQSMIAALQTLVKKGVAQPPARFDQPITPPADRLDTRSDRGGYDNQRPQNDNDWGADIRSELDSNRNAPPPADLVEGFDPPISRTAINGQSPRKVYDAGYNYLMASDYASAESTFRNFLSTYPEDDLAGNAQYWLGESFFARGNYRKAAGEFLKGYKSYKDSSKAPDNLLKLGMSLQRLGQSDAACQTFNELKSRYKSLPGHISRNVDSEMRKAKCS